VIDTHKAPCNSARVRVGVQLLQSLEAAVAQQGSASDTSLTATLQARISAAEAAGICNPLVRTACIRLRTLHATDALASLESALNHQTAAVSVAVQLSTLKAALERSQELMSEQRLLQYLSAWHMRLPEPGLAMFAEASNLSEAGDQDGESNGDDSAQKQSQGSEDTPRRDPKGAEADRHARQRALQGGSFRLVSMDAAEAEGVLQGVEEGVVAEFGALCDSLLVMVGRGLAGVERLDAEVLRIEADKAEAVCFALDRLVRACCICCCFTHASWLVRCMEFRNRRVGHSLHVREVSGAASERRV
jgi:hypothetical protein